MSISAIGGPSGAWTPSGAQRAKPDAAADDAEATVSTSDSTSAATSSSATPSPAALATASTTLQFAQQRGDEVDEADDDATPDDDGGSVSSVVETIEGDGVEIDADDAANDAATDADDPTPTSPGADSSTAALALSEYTRFDDASAATASPVAGVDVSA